MIVLATMPTGAIRIRMKRGLKKRDNRKGGFGRETTGREVSDRGDDKSSYGKTVCNL